MDRRTDKQLTDGQTDGQTDIPGILQEKLIYLHPQGSAAFYVGRKSSQKSIVESGEKRDEMLSRRAAQSFLGGGEGGMRSAE